MKDFQLPQPHFSLCIIKSKRLCTGIMRNRVASKIYGQVYNLSFGVRVSCWTLNQRVQSELELTR